MTIVYSKAVEFDDNGNPSKYFVEGYVDDDNEDMPKEKIAKGSKCANTETGLVSVFSEKRQDWIPWMTLKEE